MEISADLPRQQWSLLNRFRTEQGHCGACRRKWRLTDTDLCPCGETQTTSHIVESCPLTKLNGSLSRLHSADEDAVSWLTRYGSWNVYEKKKNMAKANNYEQNDSRLREKAVKQTTCWCSQRWYGIRAADWGRWHSLYTELNCRISTPENTINHSLIGTTLLLLFIIIFIFL